MRFPTLQGGTVLVSGCLSPGRPPSTPRRRGPNCRDGLGGRKEWLVKYYAVLWIAGLVAIAVVFELVGRLVQAVVG